MDNLIVSAPTHNLRDPDTRRILDSKIQMAANALLDIVHPHGISLPDALKRIRSSLIAKTLVALQGNRSATARYLGYRPSAMRMYIIAEKDNMRFTPAHCRCDLRGARLMDATQSLRNKTAIVIQPYYAAHQHDRCWSPPSGDQYIQPKSLTLGDDLSEM